MTSRAAVPYLSSVYEKLLSRYIKKVGKGEIYIMLTYTRVYPNVS
jgi:hypothetical protein